MSSIFCVQRHRRFSVHAFGAVKPGGPNSNATPERRIVTVCRAAVDSNLSLVKRI